MKLKEPYRTILGIFALGAILISIYILLAMVICSYSHAENCGSNDDLRPKADVTIRKYVDADTTTRPNWYQADQDFIQSQPLPGLTDFTIHHEIVSTDSTTGTTTIISGDSIYPLGINTDSVVSRLLDDRSN